MKKVALIGAGQLGSRHLQGFANSIHDISIEVVEPFENAREIARERFSEIKNGNFKNIEFYGDINQLSNDLFMVIVATNADVRFKVTKELLEKKNVRNLILEKVLFQNINEYKLLENILSNCDTKCWVNHPRRMYPFYINLKKELLGAKKINFSISGGNWGLGCNGLHFLDCVEFLTNEKIEKIDNKYINEKLYETKRKGFKEINGLIVAETVKSSVQINSFSDNSSPLVFSITSDKLNIVIDEVKGNYRLSSKNNNWEIENTSEKIIYFQSELTNLILDKVINNECQLPTYNEAMELHIKFISGVLEKINSFSEQKYDICPIT